MNCDYVETRPDKPPPIRKLTPLFVIVGAGCIGLVYAIIRNGLTRDDVRFAKSIPMNCEKFDEQPKSRKFITFNQKYKTPEGLAEALAALEEPTEEELKAMKK